ncbi:hypothetical protein FOL47_008432 [Perkinsus chesapeaki]|uniref:Uncharacterized protein n=1 Tax=Perkinsus chesapeaki TaxID=330153 RepID=A0A7J6MTT7_PERCH|nr:hypothetical protein FOL47_008432 [Perkinsus chesapeaki]
MIETIAEVKTDGFSVNKCGEGVVQLESEPSYCVSNVVNLKDTFNIPVCVSLVGAIKRRVADVTVFEDCCSETVYSSSDSEPQAPRNRRPRSESSERCVKRRRKHEHASDSEMTRDDSGIDDELKMRLIAESDRIAVCNGQHVPHSDGRGLVKVTEVAEDAIVSSFYYD